MRDFAKSAACKEDHARLHQAGSAWTDRGTQGLVSDGPGGWESAVECHRRAVELLSQLPVDENSGYLADLGAAWVNLGCALQMGASRESLGHALDAFDRAVGFLERLPHHDNPRFRHNLATAWMNKADTLARSDGPMARTGALKSYVRAIEIGEKLPLDEKPSFRVLLASTWINLGNLHQRGADYSEAVLAYDGAVAALGSLQGTGHRLACHHAATAWTNRAEALLLAGTRGSDDQALDSARKALEQIEGRDLGGAVVAKLSLRALRAQARSLESLLCSADLVEKRERLATLTDVAERGLDLAFLGRGTDAEFFDPFIAWFFSFGSRIYGKYQPQFLPEYLGEVLGRWDCRGNPGIGPDLRVIASQATAGALEELGRSRLLVEGSRQTGLLLQTVKELRGSAAQFCA